MVNGSKYQVACWFKNITEIEVKRVDGSIRFFIVGFLKIQGLFLLFTRECRFFAVQFIYKLKVLSRKVEGLDPVKP